MKTFLKKAALAIASAVFLAMMVTASYFVVTSLLKGFAPNESKPAATQTSPDPKPEVSTPTEATPTEATPADALPEDDVSSEEEEEDVSSDEESEIVTQEMMYTGRDTTVYELPDDKSEILGTIPKGKEVLAIQTYSADDAHMWEDSGSDGVVDEVQPENTFVRVVYQDLTGYAEFDNLTYEKPKTVSNTSSKSESKPESKPDTSSGGTSSKTESKADTSSRSDSGSSGNTGVAAIINSAKLNPTKTGCVPLDKLAQAVLDKCTNSSMSTYEKVKAVYDYLIKNTVYGLSFIDDEALYSSMPVYKGDIDSYVVREAYALLKNKVGVCDNYAGAFTVLTRAIGLDSYYIGGEVTAYEGGYTGHAWNNVIINGTYYIFDAQIEDNDYNRNGSIRYIYFCKRDSELSSMYKYSDRNYYIKNFKNFDIAPTLKTKIKVALQDDSFTNSYNALKSYPAITDNELTYEGNKKPKASVIFNVTSGTAPYTVQLYIEKEETGITSTVYEKTAKSNKKTQTLSYTLPDAGFYTLTYSVTDATNQTVHTSTYAMYISTLPISDVQINCEKYEGNEYIISMDYKNGGRQDDIEDVFTVVDTATGEEIEYTAITASFSYIYPLKKGHTYKITLDVTDAFGNKAHAERQLTAK